MLFFRKTLLICLISIFCIYGLAAYTAEDLPSDDPLKVSIDGNLWEDMQNDLSLADATDHYAVRRQIKQMQINKSYLRNLVIQCAPYIYYVYQQTRKYDMPAEIALLPMVESGYDPFQYSHVGAVGLWQIMPGTASGFGLKINWWYDGRRDVIASTKAALHYLNYLHDYLNNDWLLAIAAYDSGEGTVMTAMKHNKKQHKPVDFWSLSLPSETQKYLPKLLAIAAIIRDPENYGIDLPPVNDGVYLTEVDVGSQIDLAQAAKLADISVPKMRKLNPGYRRWATDPEGPFKLLLPIDKADAFVEKLNGLPKEKRITWQKHTVTNGNSLGGIAHKYHTKISVIKQVNQLKSDNIRIGQVLLIPEAFRGKLNSPILRQRATIAEEKLPGPKRVLHIVKPNDTLWILANKYRVSVRQLRFWNNLRPRAKIKPKDKILIWAPKHRYKSSSYTYKVVNGDSLSVIAKKFSTTSKTIRKANHLSGSFIRIGQMLRIPKG